MNFLQSKYRIKLQTFFIVVYISSIIACTFHYHHFVFSNIAAVDSEKNVSSNHFQIVSGGNYECIIQHNLNNLQTSLILQFYDSSIIQTQNLSFHNFKFSFRIDQVHQTDNLLRAPPSLS